MKILKHLQLGGLTLVLAAGLLTGTGLASPDTAQAASEKCYTTAAPDGTKFVNCSIWTGQYFQSRLTIYPGWPLRTRPNLSAQVFTTNISNRVESGGRMFDAKGKNSAGTMVIWTQTRKLPKGWAQARSGVRFTYTSNGRTVAANNTSYPRKDLNGHFTPTVQLK